MSTDPKKANGDLKCPMHLLPTVALRAMARALYHGAVTKGYGIYNWRAGDGIKTSTYTAALQRHTLQLMDGEDVDAESGESHLAHIMATCAILMDAESAGKLIDDRVKAPKIAGRPAIWEPQCGFVVYSACKNAEHPVVCGSCVERLEDWTNFSRR